MSEITQTCKELEKFLLEKNNRYGDSALKPMRIFSSTLPEEALKTRIDDKLSRIAYGAELRKNDVVDLIGYLLLLCIAQGWTDFSDMID